jgi:hypothetical protein
MRMMLAVVQTLSVRLDAARPAAELSGGLEDGHLCACSGQLDGGGETCPAAADDRRSHPRTQVRQAIHSLRIGVSEVRWVRTW